jgi:hypothetical protein
MPITRVTDPQTAEKNLASLASDVKEEIAMPTLSDEHSAEIGDALVRGSFFYTAHLADKTFGFATLSTEQLVSMIAADSTFRDMAREAIKAERTAAGRDPDAMIQPDDIKQTASAYSAAGTVARHLRTLDGNAISFADAYAYMKSLSPLIVAQLHNFVTTKNQEKSVMVFSALSSDANVKKSPALA